ncbi:MAG: rane-flanked domain [Mucilaginibacter sp.]|nr:rane-flanked domain [Mucilaginibacter sp.]
MSFIEKNLASNEKIVYTTGLHWWVYFKNILLLVLGIIFVRSSGGIGAAESFGAFLVFVGLIGSVYAFFVSKSSEFAITNKRVILKTGILKRKLVELQLNKAEGLRVEQGIIGRMFNFGSIKITSGGVTESFSPLAKPFDFKKQVNNAVEGSFVVSPAVM